MYKKIGLVLILLNILNVNATCSIVQNTGLVFKDCDNNAYNGCKTQANISLSCSSPTSINLTLSQGSADNFNPRKLKDLDTGNSVSYNVFLDAPNTTIFGDGTQNTGTISSNCSGICNFVVYGTILSNVTLAGNYKDSQTILTINY